MIRNVLSKSTMVSSQSASRFQRGIHTSLTMAIRFQLIRLEFFKSFGIFDFLVSLPTELPVIEDSHSSLVFDTFAGSISLTQWSSVAYLIITSLILAISAYGSIALPSTATLLYNLLVTSTNLSLVAIAIGSTVQVSYGSDSLSESLSLIYLLLMILLLCYVSFIVERDKLARYIRPKLSMSSSCWPMIKLVFSAMPLVERSESSEFSKDQMQTVLKLLLEEQLRFGSLGEKVQAKLQQALKMKHSSFGVVKADKVHNTYKELCYDVIGEILASLVHRFPKEMYIRLLYAYLLAGRLHLRWLAVYQIEGILASQCTIAIKVAAVRFQSLIEYEVREIAIYSTQNLGIDAMKILKQQRYYESLKDRLKRGCEINRLFWEELQEKKPSANKLQDLGFEIAASNDIVNLMFRGSSEGENSQGLRVLEIFGEYQMLVSNEVEDSKRILTKAHNIRQSMAVSYQFSSDRRLKSIENLNPCIVVASGDFNTMGTVLQVNKEALSLLELSRHELVGEKLDIFLPKIYADHHDFWMKRYFTTNKERVVSTERKVFSKNRRGFMLPCNLLIKVVPKVSEGIKIVGVFTELKSKKTKCTVLVSAIDGQILGITKESYDLFGLHPTVCYGSGHASSICNILQLFPELPSLSNLTLESEKTHTSDLTMTTKPLESAILASRTELFHSGVPPPKPAKFRDYSVRVLPQSVKSYGAEGLRLFELEIEDVCGERDRRGSNAGMGIAALGNIDKAVAEEMLGIGAEKDVLSPVPKKTMKKLRTLTNRQIKEHAEEEEQEVQQEYTEAQIEEMNTKAERERKLKEHRQMLKLKKIPSHVLMMYLTTLLVLTTALCCHVTTLAMKASVKDYFLQANDAVVNMQERKSDTAQIAFYAMKLKNKLQ